MKNEPLGVRYDAYEHEVSDQQTTARAAAALVHEVTEIQARKHVVPKEAHDTAAQVEILVGARLGTDLAWNNHILMDMNDSAKVRQYAGIVQRRFGGETKVEKRHKTVLEELRP